MAIENPETDKEKLNQINEILDYQVPYHDLAKTKFYGKFMLLQIGGRIFLRTLPGNQISHNDVFVSFIRELRRLNIPGEEIVSSDKLIFPDEKEPLVKIDPNLGGGFINIIPDRKEIIILGESINFGQADFNVVKDILVKDESFSDYNFKDTLF